MSTLCGLALACALLVEGRALYSPATLPGDPSSLWVGGWRTEADIGPDRIYRLDRTTGELTLALARDGAHVNDPSLVRPPSSDGWDRSGWVFMYYTGLDNADAAAEAWDRHWIGLASSTDNGRSWFDHGPILSGWSPSALVVGEEIWIYYHDALATGWRVRVNGTGWQALAAPERLAGVPFLSNLDVSGPGPFVLAANSSDLTRLILGVSLDGLAFQAAAGPAAPFDAAYTVTPHLGPDGTLYVATTADYLTGPYRVLAGRR